MNYKSLAWGIIDFPKDIRLPTFPYTNAIGPKTAAPLFERIISDEVIVEQIDFDTGSIEYLNGLLYDEGGDFLYIVYPKSERWIYIFSTDLEWAILLSKCQSSEITSMLDIEKAKQDFMESFLRRTTTEKAYYDVHKLRLWAQAAKIENIISRNDV